MQSIRQSGTAFGSYMLLEWIKQYLPASSFVKIVIYLHRIIETRYFLHQARFPTHRSQHILPFQEQLQCHWKHSAHWTPTKVERYILVIKFNAFIWHSMIAMNPNGIDTAKRPYKLVS
jgi:hypothetical protein